MREANGPGALISSRTCAGGACDRWAPRTGRDNSEQSLARASCFVSSRTSRRRYIRAHCRAASACLASSALWRRRCFARAGERPRCFRGFCSSISDCRWRHSSREPRKCRPDLCAHKRIIVNCWKVWVFLQVITQQRMAETDIALEISKNSNCFHRERRSSWPWPSATAFIVSEGQVEYRNVWCHLIIGYCVIVNSYATSPDFRNSSPGALVWTLLLEFLRSGRFV